MWDDSAISEAIYHFMELCQINFAALFIHGHCHTPVGGRDESAGGRFSPFRSRMVWCQPKVPKRCINLTFMRFSITIFDAICPRSGQKDTTYVVASDFLSGEPLRVTALGGSESSNSVVSNF